MKKIHISWPGKVLEKEKNENVLENPGNFYINEYEISRTEYCWHDLYPLIKQFLPQTTILENFNFDLEKSWKSPGKVLEKS